MKYFNLQKSLIIFVLFLCCFNVAAKETSISGRVASYKKLDSSIFIDKSISVVYYDMLGNEERVTSKYSENGDFKLQLDILYPQVILIQSGSGYYSQALINPGENLKMLLRYDVCTVRTQNYPAVHYKPDFETAFVGDGASIKNSFFSLIIKLGAASASIEPKMKLGNIDSLNKQLENVPQLVENFFSTNPIYSPSLIPFAKNATSYTLIAKFLNNRYDSINSLKISEIKFPEFKYLSSSVNYVIRWASRIPDLIQIQSHEDALLKNPFFKFTTEEKQLIQKNLFGTLDPSDSIKFIKMGDKYENNLLALSAVDSSLSMSNVAYYFKILPIGMANLLAGREIIELKKDINNHFSYMAFLKKIDNKELVVYLNKHLANEHLESKDVSYTKATESDIIKSIIAKYPNKNIYVDVWATWCAPCRAEFPYYPNVIDKYEKNVEFVLLCVSSQENDYKEIIGKLPFNAHHYFLDNIQYTNLKNEFSISGIPHYLFITKKGKIINNFLRPSNFDGLKLAIEKEL